MRSRGRSIDAAFTGTLKEAQELAVKQMLNEECGILNAATAFGKTVV